MSLYHELKRRNVFRVGAAYVVAAWLIIQVAETILPLFGFGDSPTRIAVILLAIGFPLFLLFSWVFELTQEGLKLEKHVRRDETIASQTGKKLDRIIIVLLTLALGYFAIDKFLLEPVRIAEIVEETAQQARSEALVESFGEMSIAVLPFVNMSDDASNEYFADGISEELLNLLGNIPELRVTARTSSFYFKGKDIRIPEIAESLNVAHILEGSVRKAGKLVRITAQLIEARSNTHLWSEAYDRELTAQNIFAIQNEIAVAITNELQLTLTAEDEAVLSRVPTQNLQAYEAYLLGRKRMTNRTSSGLFEAAEYFDRAVQLDPLYALAHVGLADTYLLLGNYGYLPLKDALAWAEPAFSRALSLNEQLGAVYPSIGFSRTLQGDSVGAENAYKRAIELDPNYATSYHWYADLLINSFGQPGAAIPLAEKARELDPLSPMIIITLGEANGGVGNIPEAIRLYRKAIEVEPGVPTVYFMIGMAYLSLGDDVKAEFWIDRNEHIRSGAISVIQARAFLHMYRDEEEQALQLARQLQALSPGNNISLVALVKYGRYHEALDTVAAGSPQLDCAAGPVVSRNRLFQAMNLSLALEKVGERVCADLMLDGILEQLQEMPRQGYRSFGFLDAEIHARKGETRQALKAIRDAIDAGVRIPWWSQVERSPHMVSLRDNPDFKSLVAELRTDMAVQLARVREMEAKGDLGR